MKTITEFSIVTRPLLGGVCHCSIQHGGLEVAYCFISHEGAMAFVDLKLDGPEPKGLDAAIGRLVIAHSKGELP